MAQVFLPYVELLWKKYPAPLTLIKDAGFDGVECHLIGRLLSSERVLSLREEVKNLGLEIRFHQGWSWETGQRILPNYILRPIGSLVPNGMTLADQMLDVGDDPVVVYGNHVDGPFQANYVYQTASEFVYGETYAMEFQDFVSTVADKKSPIVFDTQHVVEWYLNHPTVDGIPLDQTAGGIVTDMWEKFHAQVKEIHLCDFNPRLGPTRGRNVPLGKGMFPLEKFCADVRASGWDGVITPEVSFQHLTGLDALKALRAKIESLF